MSPYTCPQGHTSEAGDYCDTCGAPIAAGSSVAGAGGSTATGSGSALGATPGGPSASAGSGGAPSVPAPATAAPPGARTCPSCSAPNDADALFCEACGYDFTTGAMPRPPDGAPGPGAAPDGQSAAAPSPVPPPVALEWVAEVWVDPDWYAAQESEDPCPSAGPPTVVPLTVQSVLVGRRSVSRNIHPQVDCSTDTGVSRRQAQLTTDGQRWWVEDLQSANGTYVGPASGPLPTAPLPPGQRHGADEDQRVYIGAWTRLVIRRATVEEKAAQAT